MGRDRPSGGRGPGIDEDSDGGHASGLEAVDGQATSVALTRTGRGWTVVSPTGAHPVGDLVEGLSLADLVAEEFGALVEPDRTARRSARGPSGATEQATDPVDARVAALERTVAQLEHALAARVSTERAIGVLAERHGISARSAFESLRGDARSQGRPVAQLAREVLDGLGGDTPAPGGEPASTDGAPPANRSVPAPHRPRPGAIAAVITGLAPREPAAATAADGRS